MINWIKYTLLTHIALGLYLLGMHHFWFKCMIQNNLYWIAVCIAVGFYAGVIEFMQPKLKLGTTKAIGAMKTCIPLAPYIIYQITQML